MSKTTYLLYADASGDDGTYILGSHNSSTSYYAISGIIINIEHWQSILDRIVRFRKALRDKYGFLMRKELKGASFFHLKNSELFMNTKCTRRKERLRTYHFIMALLPEVLEKATILNLFLDKKKTSLEPEQYFDICWKYFLERFQTFLNKNDGMGIFIPDEGKEKELIYLTRKLRKYNPVKSHYGGSYSFKIQSIVEDPFHRDSKDSYFIQLCDLIVHALYRREEPKGSFKKYNGDRLFDYIEPLLLKEASGRDPHGIIRP